MVIRMDKKAKKILFNTYWSSKGWKDYRTCYTSPEDFEYAKQKGLMFDRITISHDECVKRVVNLANTITQEQVAKAFLCSLSTRRLDWRSALRDKMKEIEILKANKAERDVIIEILACIGILNPKSYDRKEAGKHDWTYATYWRGEDGYDKEVVNKYFGKYL